MGSDLKNADTIVLQEFLSSYPVLSQDGTSFLNPFNSNLNENQPVSGQEIGFPLLPDVHQSYQQSLPTTPSTNQSYQKFSLPNTQFMNKSYQPCSMQTIFQQPNPEPSAPSVEDKKQPGRNSPYFVKPERKPRIVKPTDEFEETAIQWMKTSKSENCYQESVKLLKPFQFNDEDYFKLIDLLLKDDNAKKLISIDEDRRLAFLQFLLKKGQEIQ